MFLYSLPNFLRQRQQVRARTAEIHQGQRVMDGDPCPTPASPVSLGESRVLHQPGGRDFHAPVRWERGDVLPLLRKFTEGGGRQHRVGEK